MTINIRHLATQPTKNIKMKLKNAGVIPTYKQSLARVGRMSKADLERIKPEGEEIARTTAGLMTKGFSHDSPEVQEQIGRFYKHLHNFYDPSYEMFKGLGQMYVDDPRFTEVYEKRAKYLPHSCGMQWDTLVMHI